MKHLVSSFLEDETAATAIEYGLIAAGISVAIITVVARPRLEAEHHIHAASRPRSSKRVGNDEGLRPLAEALIIDVE